MGKLELLPEQLRLPVGCLLLSKLVGGEPPSVLRSLIRIVCAHWISALVFMHSTSH